MYLVFICLKSLRSYMKKYCFLLVLFAFTSSLFVSAQTAKRDSVFDVVTQMRIPVDTTDITYHFEPGDTLIYRAEAHDSIVRGFDPALLRIRYEKWMITCDSIGKDGNYHLTQVMLDYIAKETQGDIENVTRDFSPWTNRKAFFVIDSTGKRIASYPDDSTKAATGPGSVFNPPIIEALKIKKARTYQSWSLTKQLIDLNENAVPAPLVRLTSLYKNKPHKDTLGYDCYRIEFIKTGQGSFELETDQVYVDVTSVLTGYNDCFFSLDHNVLIFMNAKIEQKVRMVNGKDSEPVPGWHFIDVDYILESLKRNGKEYLIDRTK